MAKLFATDEGGTVLKRKKSITDCNDITYKIGIRFYYYGANSDNAPSTINGALVCLALASTNIYQIAITDVSKQIFIRQYRTDTWSDWIIISGQQTIYLKRWDSTQGRFSLAANTESSTIFTVPAGVYIVNSFNWNQSQDSFHLYVYVNGHRVNSSSLSCLKGLSSGSWIINCTESSNAITLYNPNAAISNLDFVLTMTKVS